MQIKCPNEWNKVHQLNNLILTIQVTNQTKEENTKTYICKWNNQNLQIQTAITILNQY